MFRDIFNGKPPRLFANGKSFLENAETALEMHYITRSGSIENSLKITDEDLIDGNFESENRWSEDPLLGENLNYLSQHAENASNKIECM